MSDNKSMGQALLDQMQAESGWHESRTDSNKHLSIKNADGTVIGHMYPDGSMKGTNSDDSGRAGALPWLMPKR